MGSYYSSMALVASRSGSPGQSIPVLTVPFASIIITQADGQQAPVYGDQALTVPLTQPLTADAVGNFGFFIASGTYTATVTSATGASIGVYPFSVGGTGGGGGVTPFQQTPSGTVDGTNRAFTLTVTPQLLWLDLNGQLLTPNVGYTLSGSSITMATAPQTGDSLYARGF